MSNPMYHPNNYMILFPIITFVSQLNLCMITSPSEFRSTKCSIEEAVEPTFDHNLKNWAQELGQGCKAKGVGPKVGPTIVGMMSEWS